MKKKRALVVCPGRGSYTKETLGYLKKAGPEFKVFQKQLDEWRKEKAELTITELDEMAEFKPGIHTKGENASTLIYACSAYDFSRISREYEVVAITGNSMGWYLALAFAGALAPKPAFEVINTMGSMMKEKIIGGQVIFPVVNENWHYDLDLEKKLGSAIESALTDGGIIEKSIDLGGYRVLGGDSKGLQILMQKLPKIDKYPFQLINHAAFHTSLLTETSDKAFELLPEELFAAPKIPAIDGRGKIWGPFTTDQGDLWDYTLGHQVFAPYDFTTALKVGIKEFAPDQIIGLGPGNPLGGVIGQVLVAMQWRGVKSKSDFSTLQSKDPYVISMGL